MPFLAIQIAEMSKKVIRMARLSGTLASRLAPLMQGSTRREESMNS
jgi:hypothetical protein